MNSKNEKTSLRMTFDSVHHAYVMPTTQTCIADEEHSNEKVIRFGIHLYVKEGKLLSRETEGAKIGGDQ